MPLLRKRSCWVTLLATMLTGACAAEVGEVEEGPELEPAIEPVAEALSNPARQFAVKLDLSTRPEDEDYVPDDDYRLNVTKVVRHSTGVYWVHLNSSVVPNTAIVATLGGGIARCKFSGYAGSAGTTAIKGLVRCHNAFTGDPANSRFVFSAFTAGTGITGRAAGGRINANGTVIASSLFNTRGGVSATRTSAGQYTVFLGGLGVPQKGGTVQVTAEGVDGGHCKVANWLPDPGLDVLAISVKCFPTRSTVTADSAFSFLYDEGIATSFNRGAYAWANNATSASYQPEPFYTFSRGPGASDSGSSATASLVRNADGSLDTGHYKMIHRGPREANAKRSYLFVGAYGSGPEFCNIVSWSTVAGCSADCDIEAHTQCFNENGTRTNTRYVQTWGSFNGLLPD